MSASSFGPGRSIRIGKELTYLGRDHACNERLFSTRATNLLAMTGRRFQAGPPEWECDPPNVHGPR